MNTIGFCTTCKGRTQHISKTLPQNLVDNPTAKFVVVDYNDKDGLADYLKAYHSGDIATGRLVVYQYRAASQFRMAHAKNMAHRLAMLEGADILVNVDADNFTGPGFAEYVSEQFNGAGSGNMFLWSRMVKEGEGRLPRGISGRMAVTRDDFILTGGYDERYEAYSPDDKDFKARLLRLGLDGREIDPIFLKAILHTDRMRYKEYPDAEVTAEDFVIQHKYTVVNSGNVGCGRVYRNFGDEPVIVTPFPTRIFGIGMHKTATTSLHHAFKQLGLKSGHWQNAHWAKAIWREMNQIGRSPTLEKFYCLCDLPIPMLFMQLDRAYPGSKFILTIRNEAKWLASVRNHFDPDCNQYRSQWDHDPFSNRVHQLLYGRTDFEPRVFMERYRRHNAEVQYYFRNRPQDLLVMDMDKGHGWAELCEFLNVPVPKQPYPKIIST